MDAEMVADVRRFNRLFTQRIGALDDHYLARDRPLGPARVLWEIGREGCDLRTLRARLDLDSGYLSRLVRALERAGLVTVQPRADDRRVRVARLTAAGLAERAELDRRSDDLVRSLLAPLGAAQRARLVAAMGDVERLLTAALVEVEQTDPRHPDAHACIARYFAELERRFEEGFDADRSLLPDIDELRDGAGVFLVARLRGDPVGCGALVFHPPAPPDIKRMWVAESARGLGLGRRLLAELEAHAVAHGSRTVRLETNRALVEAIALYRSAGYREVPPFNDELYADHWFEKDLAPG
jgi:DNA-binding MarR family transcriptional regulator/GNAT superfamily N-acetyltransferase